MKGERGVRRRTRGWDELAAWYDGWVGPRGSEHHRRLAIPATLELLTPRAGERILDIGCGQGVLAPHIAGSGARYTGVDVSSRLLALARRHHGKHGRFLRADAADLRRHRQLAKAEFEATVFLLSLQDMAPLAAVIASARSVLAPAGRLVILMTHPCFRVPRQSGWGWDEGRKLRFRRVDHYLTPLPVPMKAYPGGSGTSTSFHRPLGEYVAALAEHGLWLDALRELPALQPAIPKGKKGGGPTRAEARAQREIPLFLALRAHLAE